MCGKIKISQALNRLRKTFQQKVLINVFRISSIINSLTSSLILGKGSVLSKETGDKAGAELASNVQKGDPEGSVLAFLLPAAAFGVPALHGDL